MISINFTETAMRITLLFITTFLVNKTAIAAPPLPSPVCHIKGIIQSVDFIEAHDASCLAQEYGCPTDIPLHNPDRYFLNINVQEVSYVEGTTEYKSCEEMFPMHEIKRMYINKGKMNDGDTFKSNQRIEGVTYPNVVNTFDSYSLTTHLDTDFSDVKSSHPYNEAISYVKSQDIVNGYPDGTYRPDSTINRAEFIKIIINSIYEDSYVSQCPLHSSYLFPDVLPDSWFAPYVCSAKWNKIVNGYDDNTFRPGESINFVEAAKIITQSFGVTGNAMTNPEPWYINHVYRLQSKNAIPLTIYGFDKKITRGEMAEMVYRLLGGVVTEKSLTYGEIQTHNQIDTESVLNEDYYGAFVVKDVKKAVPPQVLSSIFLTGDTVITGFYQDYRMQEGMGIPNGFCFDRFTVDSLPRIPFIQDQPRLRLCLKNPEVLDAYHPGHTGWATVHVKDILIEYSTDTKYFNTEWSPNTPITVTEVLSVEPEPKTQGACWNAGGKWTTKEYPPLFEGCFLRRGDAEIICPKGVCDRWTSKRAADR